MKYKPIAEIMDFLKKSFFKLILNKTNRSRVWFFTNLNTVLQVFTYFFVYLNGLKTK